jgi:formate dehydrogenase beta subunit
MAIRLTDMTRKVDLTRERGTGPVRERRPVYLDFLPPCNDACPAGENVQAWLDRAQTGKYRDAWEVLIRDNPMPAVHGRVCYHPCEDACNRGQVDAPVSIHAVERFLGDRAIEENWPFRVTARASGRKILIVGAGPCGLSAAYHLALLGHEVEIREAGPLPGGMMHFGIPAYRLPRSVLMAEVDRIKAMGVRIVTGHKVTDLLAEKESGGFDAALIAIGAGIGKHVDIPARDAVSVLDAVSLLHDAGAGERPLLGRRVVVYGGGNTAMEGVKIKWLTTIKQIAGPELTVERMEIDADGRPHPTGQLETLSADAVVLALGQETDSGFLRAVPGIEFAANGAVRVGPDMMTGHSSIFAGGDMVPGEQSVTQSVGHGKRAARNIDAWLRGQTYEKPPKNRLVTFDMLELPVYSDAEPSAQPSLAVSDRGDDFAEIVSGLTERQAVYETQRCYSCGNCFECDNCYAACPEAGAIIKLGPGQRYRFDYDICTGCAVCYEQCPCHAIEMTAEPDRHG